MKLTNPNYCARVVKINSTNKLEWCDNLVGVNLFWYNILTWKDINLDSLHILITAETQLDEEFLYENNLYSSAEMNKDVMKKGYIWKNWRIRAIKLRWHPSNAVLMPLDSLSYIPWMIVLSEWDEFNELWGKEICRKYELPTKSKEGRNKVKWNSKRYTRIDWKNFPEHFSTEQFLRNEFKFKVDDRIIITQKLHGTSVRLSNLEVKIRPTLIDKILRKKRCEYDYLAWSRRVIKDLKSDKVFQHYYNVEEWNLDIYNKALNEIKDKIPKDTIIYGELVGYNGQSPIQKGYTYGEAVGNFSLYIYRITSINADGLTVDWHRDIIKSFCKIKDLKYVPELDRLYKSDFEYEDFLDTNFSKNEMEWKEVYNERPIFLEPNMIDEWICIRRESYPQPYITKIKSPLFYEFETKLLDKGVEVAW